MALAIKMDCMNKFVKWFGTMKYTPNFTTLAETGKPTTTGKKTARRGVSKKSSKAIKLSIANAEDSGMEWTTRGADPSDDESISEPTTQPLELSSQPSSSGDQDATSPSTTVIMSQARDVRSISISNIHTTVGSPPPLVQATSAYVCSPPPKSFSLPHQERPFVESPFWLTFIFGNISRCNGCKGKISRGPDRKLLPPPDDVVFGHKEYVVFQNPNSGMFEQSREKRNVYYHPWLTCIAPHFRNFQPNQHITISVSVKEKLNQEHKDFLGGEFGILL